MVNTSATGGPLLPADAPAPLEGKELKRFFQQWIVGITGLPGDLVRVRWQDEPPSLPDEGDAWVSVGIGDRASDTFPEVKHLGDQDGGNGVDQLRRNEEIELLNSFYDLGSNGRADHYGSILRDGLAIAQNLEPLALAGMGFVQGGNLTAVPVLVKQRWNYRVDLRLKIRRMITRNYPVRNLQSASGEIKTGTVDIDFNA